LVEAVANELALRGIIAWLDRNEILLGGNLDEVLEETIRQNLTFTVFLSGSALQSPWVDNELTVALEKAASNPRFRIYPIYLGKPGKLVKSHPQLRQKWLDEYGKVLPIGHEITGYNADKFSPKRNHRIVREIAERISASIYGHIRETSSPHTMLYFDQRGRSGKGDISGSLTYSVPNASLFVFRPDTGKADNYETLTGAEWKRFSNTVRESLKTIFTANRKQEIHIQGNAQLALPFLVGRCFDRKSPYDRFG